MALAHVITNPVFASLSAPSVGNYSLLSCKYTCAASQLWWHVSDWGPPATKETDSVVFVESHHKNGPDDVFKTELKCVCRWSKGKIQSNQLFHRIDLDAIRRMRSTLRMQILNLVFIFGPFLLRSKLGMTLAYKNLQRRGKITFCKICF